MESPEWFRFLDNLYGKDPSLLDDALGVLLKAKYGSKLRPNAAAIVRNWRERNENRRLLQTIEPPRD